jgi:hypothetical protein
MAGARYLPSYYYIEAHLGGFEGRVVIETVGKERVSCEDSVSLIGGSRPTLFAH